MWQGGNQWSGWVSYLSFFRHVVKLNLIEYEAFDHYEVAALAGPRAMHSDFCIVSDRPEFIKRDELNRSHCDDGPSHRWRDGWSLWYIHGVKVTQQIVEDPESISTVQIEREQNAEVRRIMIERLGTGKYLMESGAKIVDQDFETARKGAAPRALILDKTGQKWLVGTDGSTARCYYMPVPSEIETCKQAHCAICGFDEMLIVNKS